MSRQDSINLVKPYVSKDIFTHIWFRTGISFFEADPNIFNFPSVILNIKLQNQLNRKQIQDLEDMLCKYSEVFWNEEELVTHVRYNFELLSNNPIRVRICRMSPTQNDILKSEIHKLL